MASGLPIISTAAGGVPELIKNKREGFIVRVGDVRGLSNSMSFLLDSPEARRSFGAAGACRAKDNFDVPVMIRAYEELYENLHHRVFTRQESVFAESVLPAEGGETRLTFLSRAGQAISAAILPRLWRGLDTNQSSLMICPPVMRTTSAGGH
jgi:hypothetical protein